MRLLLPALVIIPLLFGACSSGADDEAPEQSTDAPSATAAPSKAATTSGSSAAQTVSAFQTSTNTTVSLKVSSPVARSANATASVETSPGAECTITYDTPSKTRSDAAGLEKKKADANGKASWSWTIGPSTQTGQGLVRVFCNGQDDVQPIVIT